MMHTEMEILTMYRQAKDKTKQIGIMAELNQCQKREIIEILQSHGEKVDGRILGGMRSGKARRAAPAEPKAEQAGPKTEQAGPKAEQAGPDPERPAARSSSDLPGILIIDGVMLRYVRRLIETENRVGLMEIMAFLLEGSG